MTSVATTAWRLVLLDLRASWRGNGTGVLLGLAAWTLLCFAQEPLLLRGFGTALGPQGAVWGAGVALCSRFTIQRNAASGHWWHGPLCGTSQCLFLAAILFALVLLAGLLPNQAFVIGDAQQASIAFLALFLPEAILLHSPGVPRFPRFRTAVAVAYAPLGAALAGARFQAPVPVGWWAAAAMLCVGAVAVVAAVHAPALPSAHAHRDPR